MIKVNFLILIYYILNKICVNYKLIDETYKYKNLNNFVIYD